jgi:alpha-beta hydrolase superfamily lysophospholipase
MRSIFSFPLVALVLIGGGCSSTKTSPSSATAGDTASTLATHTIAHDGGFFGGGKIDIRVGVQAPDKTPIADVLFFTGFADRIDNHDPLFQAWTNAGYRVVSFDYPGHGESTGSIDNYDFHGLAEIANEVEADTREDDERPLFLAGWSTGGLLAVRLVQSRTLPSPGREPDGLVLLAPGVAVHALVGDKGFVTQDTLTSNPNPPHAGPPKPKSPLLVPRFATKLEANVVLAQTEKYPGNVPTLVVVAGDAEDAYADTKKVKKWASGLGDAEVWGVQCAGAKHELDNEPNPIGDSVRAMAARFPKLVLDGGANADAIAPGSGCAAF